MLLESHVVCRFVREFRFIDSVLSEMYVDLVATIAAFGARGGCVPRHSARSALFADALQPRADAGVSPAGGRRRAIARILRVDGGQFCVS